MVALKEQSEEKVGVVELSEVAKIGEKAEATVREVSRVRESVRSEVQNVDVWEDRLCF